MHSLMAAHFCPFWCQDVAIPVYWRSQSFLIQAVKPVYKKKRNTSQEQEIAIIFYPPSYIPRFLLKLYSLP